MSGFGAIGSRLYGFFYRNPPSNRTVLELAELGPHDRVLEVGCGPGAGVALAAERIGAERVSAVDPSPTFVDMVRKRVPGADVQVAGAEDVPFPDGSFTVIWTIASMHHWDDRDTGLATLTRILADGGRLFVAERLLDRPGHGITRAQLPEVVALLQRLGHAAVDVVERPDGRRHTLAIIRAGS